VLRDTLEDDVRIGAIVGLLARARCLVARLRMGAAFASLSARLRQSPRHGLVLRYHSVAPPEEADYVSPGISLPPGRFEEQIRFLVSRYRVVALEELVLARRGATKVRDRPAVAITFDDGYLDNFRYALPVLERYGATATFYVVVGAISPAPSLWTVRLHRAVFHNRFLGGQSAAEGASPADPEAGRLALERKLIRRLRVLPAGEREARLREFTGPAELENGPGGESARTMMSWEELERLLAAGMTVGSHTLTHPLLPALSLEELKAEIAESRSLLEGKLGFAVRHFSYPNPGRGRHHDRTVRRMVRASGYWTGVTSDRGLVGPWTDPFAVPRVGVNSGLQERLLFRALGERRSARGHG
jgi:peptidoglycan/xylan/chitin deacetylase (PgdA/CDA1 family)